MVLDKLGESLRGTLQKIANALFVDEKLINELVKEIQKALLQGDVNVRLVFELSKRIKERALKEEAKGLTKKEQLIHIVYEELVNFLGGEGKKLEITGKPFFIMLVGLFGNGKTTTAGKLAHYFAKRGNKVAMLGLDVHRPAAMKQLEQLGKQIEIPVFTESKKKALDVWEAHKKELQRFDIVLVDTAGRDALSEDLIEELNQLSKAVKPQEVLLVIGADVGQAAESQAKAFHASCGVTGVVITKLDGTAKGGGALAACSITGAPVRFIGVGERTDDLEEFRPANFVSRLLGMGDIEALLEKAKEAMTEEQADDLGKRFLKGDFNLLDLYEQMEAMRKMGPLSKVAEMIPGFGSLKIPKEMLSVQEHKLKKWRHAMDSMTQAELEDPDLLSTTRIDRIARGSGVSVAEIRDMIKQYRQSKKMVKMLKGGSMKNMEKMMQRMQKSQVRLK
ncbi:MAG: signal recognition particle protein Srp54 [Nanoarchaeota archaeon]